jgi:hypothetical protein
MSMRAEFSAKTRREALQRAGGICECHRCPGLEPCGQRLGPGNTFFEHIIQDGAGGDNSLENCAVLVKTCWKRKTAEQDQPIVARVRKRRDRNFGIRPRSKFPGWRRFDGSPVRNPRR